MLYALDDTAPQIDPDVAWIAPTATLVGKIVVHAEASVWFGVVARGDNEAITIGAGSNVQENTVLHTDMGFPLSIGRGCTIGHAAILHGCTIGDGSLIGMGAIVLNGARIGRNCLIGAGSLVTEGKEIPDGSLVLGTPAKVVRKLDENEIAKFDRSAKSYILKAQGYLNHLNKIAQIQRDKLPCS